MGTGVWAMHFVGMLAYAIAVALGYTPLLTFVSWVAAVAVSAVALAIAAQKSQDRNFRFTEVSGGFFNGDGPRPALIGMSLRDMDSTGLNDAAWPAHRAGLERHEPFQDFELGRLDAKGWVRWASTSGVPLFDAAGEFTLYRGVGHDICDRKRGAQRQQMQQEVTRMLADAATKYEALPAIIRSICHACSWEGGVFRPLGAGAEAPASLDAAFWAVDGHASTLAAMSRLQDAEESDRVAARAGLGESFVCESRTGDRL